VPLSRQTDRALQVQAWDHAGNRTTHDLILHLDSPIELELLAPPANTQRTVSGTTTPLQVVARAIGMADTDTITAGFDALPPVLLTRNGNPASAELAVPGAAGHAHAHRPRAQCPERRSQHPGEWRRTTWLTSPGLLARTTPRPTWLEHLRETICSQLSAFFAMLQDIGIDPDALPSFDCGVYSYVNEAKFKVMVSVKRSSLGVPPWLTDDTSPSFSLILMYSTGLFPPAFRIVSCAL
jgi:hypothetical protein